MYMYVNHGDHQTKHWHVTRFKAFIYNKNSSRSRLLPCGTPVVILAVGEVHCHTLFVDNENLPEKHML